jgi:DNA-binding MarR family transcriptional regulator
MFRNWSKGFQQGNAVYQLNMLANATVNSIDDRYAEAVGLDIRTIRVLRLIGDNPGITFAEIATLGALERSLASRLIQTLVRGNYVERRNDATDARRFGLYITASGKTIRARADHASDQGLKLLFQELPPDEVTSFMQTMARLAQWIDSDEYEEAVAEMFEQLGPCRDGK